MTRLKRGGRIRVYWDEDQQWYEGTIRDYSECTVRHLVVYDDGDQRHENLDDPRLQWEELPPATHRVTTPSTAAVVAAAPTAAQAIYPRVILRFNDPPPFAPVPSSIPEPPGKKAKRAGTFLTKRASGVGARVAIAGSPRSRVAVTPAPAPANNAAAPTLWPCGANWQPKTHDWGTRHPDAFGCGKCRWRPSGCRGCIAAAASYHPVPAPPLSLGKVALPSARQHAHCYAHTDGPDEAEREASVGALLLDAVQVVDGPAQSDAAGFGVVAQRRLAVGELLHDLSVFFVARPADYALAHLPQFHALELGKTAYFQLREPALGHCSLTYYVNEARHAASGDPTGPAANVAYKVVRPRRGGVALALQVLSPIAAGGELLADYDQRLQLR